MTAAWAFITSSAGKYLLVGLAVLAIAGGVAWVLNNQYNKGQKSGEATVTTAVQTQTIQAVEKARIEKDKVDEEVRNTPYTDRVDGLR